MAKRMKMNKNLAKELTKLKIVIDDKALDNPLANGFLANKRDIIGFGQLAKTLLKCLAKPNQCPNFGDYI